MTFLDIFAGIGGFRLGLERAGHKCVGYVEWDKAKRKSYEAIHNPVGEWTGYDINAIDHKEVPKADIWCFGFPCTDISKNGNQLGFEGQRSSLFFAVTRLVEQLEKEVHPTFLFIENVENLLSVNGGFDFLRLLIELDRVGYDAEWQSINSRQHGLPQNRQRVYIIGHFRGRSTRKVFPLPASYRSVDLQRELDGWRVVNATKQGYDVATSNDSVNIQFPKSKTRRGRVGKGYFQTLDRQCAQAVFAKGRWRRITPREAWRIQGLPDWAFEKAAAVNSESQLYAAAGDGVSVNVIYEIAKNLDRNKD